MVAFSSEYQVYFFSYDTLVFICFYRLFMVSWILSAQKYVNQNSFDEGFPCDNPELARLSYVNIFQDTQT